MSESSFQESFAEAVDEPINAWDYAGGAAGGADEFFKQLGEISRKIQAGALGVSDYAKTAALLQRFANGLNQINARLATAFGNVGNAQDGKFAQAFKAIFVSTNNH